MARRYLQSMMVGNPAAKSSTWITKMTCSSVTGQASLAQNPIKEKDPSRFATELTNRSSTACMPEGFKPSVQGAGLAELGLTGDLLGSRRRVLSISKGLLAKGLSNKGLSNKGLSNKDLSTKGLSTKDLSTEDLAAVAADNSQTRPAKRRGWAARENLAMRLIGLILLLVVLWQWGNAGWILAKAQLAQWLIAQAWEESRRDTSQQIKPWPWADTHPVARLRMPEQGVDLLVLEGAQGNSLAFGPGYMLGTDLPGEGISVIGGHRDTHFRFLKDVQVGDELQLETRAGRWLTYRIERREVVDIRLTPLRLPEAETGGLLLITCYPFDAIEPDGPLRLVVWAQAVSETADPLPVVVPKSMAAGESPLVFSL